MNAARNVWDMRRASQDEGHVARHTFPCEFARAIANGNESFPRRWNGSFSSARARAQHVEIAAADPRGARCSVEVAAVALDEAAHEGAFEIARRDRGLR